MNNITSLSVSNAVQEQERPLSSHSEHESIEVVDIDSEKRGSLTPKASQASFTDHETISSQDSPLSTPAATGDPLDSDADSDWREIEIEDATPHSIGSTSESPAVSASKATIEQFASTSREKKFYLGYLPTDPATRQTTQFSLVEGDALCNVSITAEASLYNPAKRTEFLAKGAVCIPSSLDQVTESIFNFENFSRFIGVPLTVKKKSGEHGPLSSRATFSIASAIGSFQLSFSNQLSVNQGGAIEIQLKQEGESAAAVTLEGKFSIIPYRNNEMLLDCEIKGKLQRGIPTALKAIGTNVSTAFSADIKNLLAGIKDDASSHQTSPEFQARLAQVIREA